MVGQMDRWTYGQTNGRENGPTNGEMDGHTNLQTATLKGDRMTGTACGRLSHVLYCVIV